MLGAQIVIESKSYSFKEYFKMFYELTKQGLVFFVVLSVMVGYYLAGGMGLGAVNFLLLLVSIYLAASGAHVINQVVERDYDALMLRTCNRPIPKGIISVNFANVLGYFLMSAGAFCGLLINAKTSLVIIASAFIYLAAYTPLKRFSITNTWVGAIAGALPPVAGWTAAKDEWSLQAFFLPIVIFLWQIPHFLSLAWKYRQQYDVAGYKMLVSKDKAGLVVGWVMLAHIIFLILATFIPSLYMEVSFLYVVCSLILGGWMLFLSARFIYNRQSIAAKRIFLYSNGYLIGLFFLVFWFMGIIK